MSAKRGQERPRSGVIPRHSKTQNTNVKSSQGSRQTTQPSHEETTDMCEIRIVPIINDSSIRDIIQEFRGNPQYSSEFKHLLSAIPLLVQQIANKHVWENALLDIQVFKQSSLKIKSGNGDNEFVIWTDEDGVPEMVDITQKFINDIENVEEINKRVLAKAELRFCGNEGKEIDEVKQALRKLFKLGIDKIQQVRDPNVWKNATVIIYDRKNNSYKFKSGRGKHRFTINEVRGEPKIVYTVDNKQREINLNDTSTGESMCVIC